jgi:hypothetical protein
MANAALTTGAAFASSPSNFVVGAVIGASFGVIIWGPALILALLFLGLPMGVASAMANNGLAGEDRGHTIVGLACASLGLFTLLPMGDPPVTLTAAAWTEAWTQEVVGVLACLVGGAVVAAASARGARRRAFLRDVESGRRCDYRVATTLDGRRLARVRVAGAGYRVVDAEEPICELDEAGRCLRSLVSR